MENTENTPNVAPATQVQTPATQPTQTAATSTVLSQAQQWFRESFKPWQAQRRRYEAEQNNQIVALRNQKAQVQYLVGLLLNGQYDRAVKGWNQLGLQPQLADVRVDTASDALIFTTTNNQVVTSDINTLIAEMQDVLAG